MSLERPPRNVNHGFLLVVIALAIAWAVVSWTLLFVK